MKFEWSEVKNNELKKRRNVCFEDFLVAMNEDRLLDVIPHHNQERFGHQKLFIVKIRDYVYYVPFVEDETKVFLKNIIPSRKYQKHYTQEKSNG